MFKLVRIHVCLLLVVPVSLVLAADGSKKISSETLHNDQLAVSGRYDRFERLLSQMADILGHEDPQRAELLRRAISIGREKIIGTQLGQIAADLSQNSLGRALEQQEEVLESLAELLRLLQSEDRRSELEKERERLNNLLKDVSNALSEQKAARASTQNSAAPSSSASKQQKAIDRATEILDEIRAHDGRTEDLADGGSTDSDNENRGERSGDGSDIQSGESSESSPSQPSGQDKEKDTNSGDDKSKGSPSREPNKGESPPEGSQNESGAPSAQSGEKNSQSQNSQPSQRGGDSDRKQTPGQDEISRARELMRAALEQLQKQLRDNALQKQDGAIEELQKAVEELQKLLLQLREEEKELILASLEARFQRMLSMQTQIYDETVDLDTTPVDEWLDTMFARSREVAQQQAELRVACDQTLGLLREDGTSVAVVLSVEDISIDMRTIAGRLRESKVGALTQSLETDIIEALKELIEATQREMQDMKSEEQSQHSQTGEQKKPPLVQLLAEIKILRSLQLRINRRTRNIDGFMAEDSENDRNDLTRQLRELTTRQQRLVESAEELAEQMSRQPQTNR